MKTKIKVPVKIVTFIHKDTGEIHSVVGDEFLESNSFEDSIFGEGYNVTGLYKAIGAIERAGHKTVITNTTVEVEI